MLLTAGCSFVWGDELEGFDNDPPTHQHLTFTHLLAEKLGIEYVNRGVCGACNEKIFREVTDHLHANPNKITHIVVLWSAWQRDEWVEYMPPERQLKIGRQNDITQFSSLRTQMIYDRTVRNLKDAWYWDGYNSRTDITHTLSKMKALEIICDAAGIKLIQGIFHRRNWENIIAHLTNQVPEEAPYGPDEMPWGDRIEAVPEWEKWLMNSMGSLKDTSRVGMGRGLDMFTLSGQVGDMKPYGHPGEKTQVIFADELYEKFIDMDT